MKRNLLAALSAGWLLAACQPAPEQAQQPASPTAQPAPMQKSEPAPEAAATVNGKIIPKAVVDLLEKQMQGRGHAAAQDRSRIIDQLVLQELLAQEAEQKKLVSKVDMDSRLDLMRRQTLYQAAVQDYLDTFEPSEEAVRALYDQRFGERNVEYKARHILVKTEDEAKKLIAQLNKKAKFETLAKKHSTDPGSKGQGGDLGWFTAERMVPEFSAAVTALKDGEYTKTPVKSEFGWHVILREQSREKKQPSFELMRQQLAAGLKRQSLQEHMDQLKSAAKVEVLEQPEAPQPPAATEPEQEQPAAGEAAEEEEPQATGKREKPGDAATPEK